MQSLQFQTAETHKLFLQTQTEASKTLQQMMDHTRRIAEASLGISVIAPEDRRPEAAAGGRKPQATEPETADRRQTTDSGGQATADKDFFPSSVIHHPLSESHQASDLKLHPQAAPARSSAPQKNIPAIETCLLEVVSHLTGYPVEMLALDMDIEADLGIDSIKRVEILATLEEKMPGLPAIPPDTLGTLKTLGQITAFLREQDGNAGKS